MVLALSTARRVFAAVVATALILLWAPGIGFGRAHANTGGNQTLGGFEIDGNFFEGYSNSGSTPGAHDWNNRVSAPAATDPVGSLDTTNFSVGSKECSNWPGHPDNCDPNQWQGGTGTASPKDDVANVFVTSALYPDSTGHLWGFFGADRQGTTGTTFFDFELNQATNHLSHGISVPTRTLGDVLVVAQQQGAGPGATFDVSATVQRWTNVEASCQAGTTAAGSAGGCWTAPQPLGSGAFYGLSNDSAITAFSGTGTVPARQFAEMAVDLTAAGAVLGCPSSGFTQMNVRTRSSDEDSSALKDYVLAPIGIPSACGALKIFKYGPDGHTAASGATFSVTPAPMPGSSQTTFTDGGSGDSDGAANGVIYITPVVPDVTYTITEVTAPPGYLTPDPLPSTTKLVPKFSTGDNAATVSFNDPLGSVTVHKTGNGGALVGSTFTLTGTSGAALGYARTIYDAASGTNNDGAADGTLAWAGLKTGGYTLHENSAPQGYDLVADETFVIQNAATDDHNGRNLTVTIDDPKHQAVMQVEKVAEADSATKIAGAVFNLYQNESGSSVDTSTATLIGSCTTTAPSGTCTVGDATHVITWDHYYWWKEMSVPSPYNLPTDSVKLAGHVTAANVATTNTAGFFNTTTFADPVSGLVTDASDGTLPDASIGDYATLSGLNSSATGTLTFTVYPPGNPTCDASGTKYLVSTLDVTGNGRYPASGLVTFTATTAGTWKWIVSYSGDSNGNLPVTGQCSDETEWSTVSKASPAIATSATDAHAADGTISDVATLSGYQDPPTGTVTFNVYTTNDCSGTAFATSTVSRGQDGDWHSDAVAVDNVHGTYYWTATYNGDANNNQAPAVAGSNCGLVDEVNNEVSHAPVIPTPVKSALPVSGTTVSVNAPNNTIAYDVAVQNTGSADAKGVMITDVVDSHATYNAGSIACGAGSSNCTPDASGVPTLAWTLDIAAGATAHVTFSVTVKSSDVNGDHILNQATVVSGLVSQKTNITDHPVAFPILDISKAASPVSGSIVQLGQRIDYTISVPNTGLAGASGVTVTDTLPAHVTVVAGTISDGGTLSNGVITWVIDIGAQSTKTLTYSVTVDSDAPQGSTLTNVATLGDKSSTTDHHVPTGALTLVKTVDKASAAYGDTLTYGFTAAATGQLDQTGVTVTDVLPKGTTYVANSAKCTDFTCTAVYDAASRTVTWQLGNMGAGTSHKLVFQVTINTPPTAADGSIPSATITNFGNIQSVQTPTTPSNVVKTVITAVLGVKVVRKPPVLVLPFTGLPIPMQPMALVAMVLIGAGIALTSTRRRRTD